MAESGSLTSNGSLPTSYSFGRHHLGQHTVSSALHAPELPTHVRSSSLAPSSGFGSAFGLAVMASRCLLSEACGCPYHKRAVKCETHHEWATLASYHQEAASVQQVADPYSSSLAYSDNSYSPLAEYRY